MVQAGKINKQHPLNMPSTESSHTNAQGMTFTTEFAGLSIHQIMTLSNP